MRKVKMSESLIAKLLSLATASHEDLDRLLAEQGSDAVAGIVFAEILARLRVSGLPQEVVVQWTVEHAGRRHHAGMVFESGDAAVEAGERPDAAVVISQDLVELVRALFAGDGRHE